MTSPRSARRKAARLRERRMMTPALREHQQRHAEAGTTPTVGPLRTPQRPADLRRPRFDAWQRGIAD